VEVVAVVVTYNSKDVVGDLLDSLPAAFGELTCAVVVVDNGSHDGTADLLVARGDCHVVRAINLGYAAGINRGAALAPPGADLLVLNPDVRMAAGSVAPLVAAARRPGVGLVVPRVLDPSGALYRSLRREPTLGRALGLTRTRAAGLSEYVDGPEEYARAHAVDWALGAVVLVPRATHDALGGWDESFFLYSEETDLCLRARDLGLQTWYEPSSEAVHVGGASGQSAATHTMQILNRVRLYRRRHGGFASAAYYLLALASELSWVVRGSTRSRTAVVALLVPSRRPEQLGLGPGLVPG